MENFTEQKGLLGLYDPQFEHDACGIGAVVDIKGRKSHQTVSDALSIVERLEHRAGKDAEGKTGDGVGIMLQISHRFFAKVADELNIRLGNEREYGVGMFFFPQNEHLRAQAMKLFELVTRKEGLEFLAWREVPVDPDAVGQKARDCMPAIWQCFIKKPAKVSKGIDFDRKLYIVRRVFEQASNGTYVPSLSSRTIVSPASGRDSRGQCVPGGPLSESRILCAGRGWQRCPAARWTAVSSSRPFLPDGTARSAGDSQGHGPGTAHPRKYSPRQRRGSTSAGPPGATPSTRQSRRRPAVPVGILLRGKHPTQNTADRWSEKWHVL